jgi:hypothetical protein
MVGTFSGKKSLKALSNKVFRFIQPTLILSSVGVKIFSSGLTPSPTNKLFQQTLGGKGE